MSRRNVAPRRVSDVARQSTHLEACLMSLLRNSGVVALAFAVVLAMSFVSSAQAADTGSVAGKVMKDDKGVAGVKVRLMSPQGKGKGDAPAAAPGQGKGKGDRPKPVAEGMSESDGSFKLAEVPAGEYVLVAQAKGQGGAREKVSVKAGETTTVNLTLTEG